MSVAVTDLFPMPSPSDSATHRPIRGRAHWFLLPLELFFLVLFGCHLKSESTELAAKTDLSRVLCYGHSTWETFIEEHAATSYTHKRTSLAVSHTSYLLQWHTLPTNSRTNILTGDTKKNLFSLWLVYFRCCVFKRSFFICIVN